MCYGNMILGSKLTFSGSRDVIELNTHTLYVVLSGNKNGSLTVIIYMKILLACDCSLTILCITYAIFVFRDLTISSIVAINAIAHKCTWQVRTSTAAALGATLINFA